MTLTLEQVAALAHGVTYTTIENERLIFHRLTAEQEDFLQKTDPTRLLRSACPAGVTLEFTTTATSIAFSALVGAYIGRTHYGFSLFVNGERHESVEGDIPLGHTQTVETTVPLGEGTKAIVIQLPNLFSCEWISLTLDAPAFPLPNRKTNLLLLGDSITQGYDSVHPEDVYAVKLSHLLDAEVRNRSIAGEYFRPTYATFRDEFEPDIITVAYGTNDWSHKGRELLDDAEGFFRNLKITYPLARIYAILPLWRNDHDNITDFGALSELNPALRERIERIGGITVIDGYDAIPHEQRYFTDLVHPTQEGHQYYFDHIKKYI